MRVSEFIKTIHDMQDDITAKTGETDVEMGALILNGYFKFRLVWTQAKLLGLYNDDNSYILIQIKEILKQQDFDE